MKNYIANYILIVLLVIVIFTAFFYYAYIPGEYPNFLHDGAFWFLFLLALVMFVPLTIEHHHQILLLLFVALMLLPSIFLFNVTPTPNSRQVQ